MRVISGVRKGLKLKAPDGTDTRPTTDRVKESLFNIIQQYLPADRVLDLFSGSAALGIEALSRHCGKCVFIENNKSAYNTAMTNIAAANFGDCAQLIKSEASAYLKSCTQGDAFDIIFMDPPYNKGFIHPILDLISQKELLAKDGIIAIETEKNGESSEHPDFKIIRQAVYGKTVITIMVNIASTRGDA